MQKQIKDIDRLLDIEKFAAFLLEHILNADKNKFFKDRVLQLAVLKSLENKGEAARQISLETKNGFKELDWSSKISARNFYVHEYFAVDWNKI